jgi:hypothetical protein
MDCVVWSDRLVESSVDIVKYYYYYYIIIARKR